MVAERSLMEQFYWNLHMRKWLRSVHTHCTNVSFLVLMLYCSYILKKGSLHHQQQKSVLNL